MQNCASAGFSTAQFAQVRVAFMVWLMMTAGEGGGEKRDAFASCAREL
jgi:hypothetical protein